MSVMDKLVQGAARPCDEMWPVGVRSEGLGRGAWP